MNIGDKVRVVNSITGNPQHIGRTGVIKDIRTGHDFPYRVRLNVGGHIYFNGSELEVIHTLKIGDRVVIENAFPSGKGTVTAVRNGMISVKLDGLDHALAYGSSAVALDQDDLAAAYDRLTEAIAGLTEVLRSR